MAISTTLYGLSIGAGVFMAMFIGANDCANGNDEYMSTCLFLSSYGYSTWLSCSQIENITHSSSNF